tara:strand:- start:2089 stop:2439 length:351 start_codon:yes stop_codon:yes gene_type:complete
MRTEIDADYEYARSKYYDMIEKNDEAIEMMMDLAREQEAPRTFEVLSNMIKQNAEIADRLMELQKKKREVEKVDKPNELQNKALTQNNVFLGSTTDLQRMLLENMKDITPTDESES